MNIWKTLGGWSEKRLNSLLIVLIDGPPDMKGRSAIIKEPGLEACGPLVSAPFWAADWAAALAAAAVESPPEAGCLISVESRRYHISALNYPRSALILGGGHVGASLSRLLRFLEFEVTLVDDRAEFLKPSTDNLLITFEAPFEKLNETFPNPTFDAVVIVTRGHAQDTACLRQALGWPTFPPYLGMIGSRRRTSQTLEMLAGEGYSKTILDKIHTPIGLKIGAQTPQEIAVSIAAEIIQELSTR